MSLQGFANKLNTQTLGEGKGRGGGRYKDKGGRGRGGGDRSHRAGFLRAGDQGGGGQIEGVGGRKHLSWEDKLSYKIEPCV